MDDHSTISEQGTCSATAVLQQTVPLHPWSTAGCVCVRRKRETERYMCASVCAVDTQISAIHETRSVSLSVL